MSGAPSLRFEVKAIREQEGLEADLLLRPEDHPDPAPGVSAFLAEPASLHLEFSVGGNSVLLQARLNGLWRLPCSRCLVEHRVPFSREFDETYPIDQEVIDASEEVRQALLLEVPPRSLCRPDCRGLCPVCGKNRNETACACKAEPPSPFEALKKIPKRA